LSDETPTRLTMEHNGGMGAMWLDRELPINPAVERERAARPWQEDERLTADTKHIRSYTVTVGDVCFLAIGQIVGRGYQCVRYQPSGCVVINSTSAGRELRDAVQAIWNSDDPRQRLLDSLLQDFSTEGVFNGDSLDGWDVGSDLQCSAAMRLLYYFPGQTAQLVSSRLKRLKLGRPLGGVNEFIKREVENGVRADDLIKATAWCAHPLVREQIIRIFRESDDPELVLASLPGVVDTKLVQARLDELIEALPAEEAGPFGLGFEMLAALGRNSTVDSKPIFTKYLQGASVQRARTMCQVLRRVRQEWAVELLSPLLDDKRPSGVTYARIRGQNEPRGNARLCDEAAETISGARTDLPFVLEGEHENLDRQITSMKERIAK
jgi:hypothetical protein